jgi:hypothetical protein
VTESSLTLVGHRSPQSVTLADEAFNNLNPASHCDIAWAGALATHAHTERRWTIGIAVAHEHGWSDENGFHPYNTPEVTMSREQAMLLSDDPSIWKTVYRH